MTSEQLAEKLGINRRTIFWMRKRYPGAPTNFNDVDKWRDWIESNKSQINPGKVDEAEVEPEPKNTAVASNISYVAARALKTQAQAEMATIQLAVTRRNIIRKEECKALFAKIAAVVRGRFLKVRADLPCTCVGLTEVEIEKVVTEKIEYALSALDIPKEFFEPQSAV
jgi:hypothetical protein